MLNICHSYLQLRSMHFFCFSVNKYVLTPERRFLDQKAKLVFCMILHWLEVLIIPRSHLSNTCECSGTIRDPFLTWRNWLSFSNVHIDRFEDVKLYF